MSRCLQSPETSPWAQGHLHDLCFKYEETEAQRGQGLSGSPALGPSKATWAGEAGCRPRWDSLLTPRLATQRSVEDEEEAAQGQHRRERDQQLRARDEDEDVEGGHSPEELEQKL